MDWYEYERPIMVTLSCVQEAVPESLVAIENIEEDFQGRDVITFICPECGETHKSLRFS